MNMIKYTQQKKRNLKKVITKWKNQVVHLNRKLLKNLENLTIGINQFRNIMIKK